MGSQTQKINQLFKNKLKNINETLYKYINNSKFLLYKKI